ncbi:MAG: family 43 glycosylhydrolase [Spirochaetales bacterium]|nr:family 43 glycosylhydrolase [Spirochaetales bacterium]
MSGTTIQNPIFPGFNADPSALWTENGCYVATSTFNWTPGVSLYHSKDFVNWELKSNILDRVSQVDLRGNGESAGIWAPHISYNPGTGLYYLVYTDVKSLMPSFFDLNNYVITAPDMEGPWSDPVYLNSSGFDPALFHDEDGRSWLTNLSWEFEKRFDHPGFIILEEMDGNSCELKGNPVEIYRGNRKFGCLEGPQIIKREGYYYLIAAEGGTGYGHAVIVSRSLNMAGPYEEAPNGPLITSRQNPHPAADDYDMDFLKPQFYNPGLRLQKAGHGSIIEDDKGRSWLFHLCARPLMPQMRCVLNRETAMQQIVWTDGWPVLVSGGCYPEDEVRIEETVEKTMDITCQGVQEFKEDALGTHWYSLKAPLQEDWCSLKKSPGVLSIRGRNSIYSAHDASVIARRIQHFNFTVETEMDLDCRNFRHMGGLLLLTGSRTFYYLRKYYSRPLGQTALGILVSRNGAPDELVETECPVDNDAVLTLICRVNQPTLQFSFRENGGEEKRIGSIMDATLLSDEYTNNGPGAFDGSFCGMTVQDLDRHANWAEFKSFSYRADEK